MVLRKLGNLRKLIRNVNSRSSKIDFYPIFSILDPANVCNLRCPEFTYWRNKSAIRNDGMENLRKNFR